MLETFHFLRPEWLIGIPVIFLLLIIMVRRSGKNCEWEGICDPALLQYQLAQQTKLQSKSFNVLSWTVPLIFSIGLFSMAGPSWEKKEQPVFQQGNALVIILDLSFSMNAKDIKPSRLERAKLKLIDILKKKKEGQTALIAFAGDSHTVSPLTIDSKTIISLLPALESSIMPLMGSHLIDALATAKQLFKNSGFAQGDILLLSDGIDSSQQNALEKSVKNLHKQGYRFSIIGVGSKSGSPIPMPRKGGFIKDSSGQVILSKLSPEPLKQLASIGGGNYYKLSLDDSDFNDLLNQTSNLDSSLPNEDNQLELWVDAGAYFILLLIPIALLSFRKGLLSILLAFSITSVFITEPSYAIAPGNTASEVSNDSSETTLIGGGNYFTEQDKEKLKKRLKKTWKNLWSTPDQQAQTAFNNQDYQTAAKHFKNNNWKASANYRAGDYEKALEQYSQSENENNLFNKGNTLANMNKFDEAIDAYKQAIEKAPETNQSIKENADKNIQYLNELLEQQKQQSSKENSDKKENDSNEQSENQDQEQKNSSDDASKSNDSSSEESEQKNSDKSDSEGSDSGEQKEETADSENENEESPDEAQASEEQQEPEKNPADKSQQQAQSEPVEEDETEPENTDGTQNDVLSQLSQEEQQSLKQWLQRIPDNPGELLRIKFRNNTLTKQRKSDSAETQYEGNPW